MNQYCVSFFGYSMRPVEDGYVPVGDEILVDNWPLTEEELRALFPGREQYQKDQEELRLSNLVRDERDRQLKEIYDPATQMLRRELETEPLDPAYEVKLIAKRTELHAYARALQGVPEQSGFPEEIIWPEIPTEELE